MPEDIILLHVCTVNEDHMIYGSYIIWYMIYGYMDPMIYDIW